jgi:hypothetical protein
MRLDASEMQAYEQDWRSSNRITPATPFKSPTATMRGRRFIMQACECAATGLQFTVSSRPTGGTASQLVSSVLLHTCWRSQAPDRSRFAVSSSDATALWLAAGP